MAEEEDPKIGDGAVIGAGSEEPEESKEVKGAEITEIFAFVAVVGDDAQEMIVSMMTPK